MPNSPIEMLMNTITGKPARPKPARKARKSASASETKVKEVKKYSQSIAKNVVSNVLKNLKSIQTGKVKSARPKPVRKSRKSKESTPVTEMVTDVTKVKEYAQTVADNVVSNVLKKLGTINKKSLRPKPVRKSRKAKSLSNVTKLKEYSQKMSNSVVTDVLKKLGSIKSKSARPKPVRKPRKSRAITMNSVSLSLNKPVEEDIKERLTLLKEQSEKVVGNLSAKLKESLKSRKKESAKNKESRKKIGELLKNKEKWAPLQLEVDEHGHIINRKKEAPGSSLNFLEVPKKKERKSRAVSLDNVKPKRSRSKSKSAKSEVAKPMTKVEKNLEQYRLDQKKKFEQRQRKSK